MIRNCCMLVAGLLLHTQIFAQDKTAASRTGEDYTLSNGAVEAVFSGSGSFDIEKLVLNGKQVVGAGKNETPWILIYKGSQGENPELKPEHAVYRGVQVRDDAQAKTLVFTWELTLDYSPVKYPVRMYVTLPDGGELLQWNIEADLPAGWLVTDLKFPNVVIERRSTSLRSKPVTRRMPPPCSSSWYTMPRVPSITGRKTAAAAERPIRRSVRRRRLH